MAVFTCWNMLSSGCRIDPLVASDMAARADCWESNVTKAKGFRFPAVLLFLLLLKEEDFLSSKPIIDMSVIVP